MSLESLHQGIVVPEHSVTVPWLVSRKSLFRHIRRQYFHIPRGTSWPRLKFTCLGVTGEFAFNFVRHPTGKLVELQMELDDTPVSTENAVPAQLIRHLGNPQGRRDDIFRWFDDQIIVDCAVAIARRRPDEPKVYSISMLQICYSAGLPDHWNSRRVAGKLPFPFD